MMASLGAANSSPSISSLPYRPISPTSSPIENSGMSVTSATRIFMQTRSPIDADRPRVSPHTRLPSARGYPSAYPTGMTANWLGLLAVHVFPYPTDAPLSTGCISLSIVFQVRSGLGCNPPPLCSRVHDNQVPRDSQRPDIEMPTNAGVISVSRNNRRLCSSAAPSNPIICSGSGSPISTGAVYRGKRIEIHENSLSNSP